MIVSFDELASYRSLVVMVDGAFDPIHSGHVAYLKAATALGLPLLCNVASDSYVQTKHRPLLPELQRIAVIDAIRYVSYTHLNERSTQTILRQLRPAAYVKGTDWKGRLPAGQVEMCDRFGIRIVFVDTVLESSTRLLQQAQQPQAMSEHDRGSPRAVRADRSW